MAKATPPQGIAVYAIDSDGKEKSIKASELKLRLVDGSVLHILLDEPDGILIGCPANADAPARLLLRPVNANAVTIAVERDEALLTLAEVDIAVQMAVKAKGLPSKKALRAWAESAMEAGLDASLTLRVVDEEEARQLNREYRQKDYATNVLSFAFNDGEPLPGMEDIVMGDVVLCAPVIAREAEEQGKTLEAHWAHMVVHGVLHLQGYDHEADVVEAEAMEALEAAILQGLGFANPYAGEDAA